MLKKIDRYITGKFLSSLVMSSLSFLVIFLVVDVVDNLRKLLDSNTPLSVGVLYSMLNLPFLFNISLPIAMMLAAVFTFGSLVKYNELTAMKSAGISLYRMLVPIVILGLIVSVLSFFFGETVVIKSSRKRHEIAQEYSLRGSRRAPTKKYNLFFQDGPARNIAIGMYSFRNDAADRVNIQYFDGKKLVKRVDARQMAWLADSSRWQLRDVLIRKFTGDMEEIERATTVDSIKLVITPESLRKESWKPEQMSYWELKEFADVLDSNGIDSKKWRVNLDFKISFAFTSLIVVLFGAPLASVKHKGGAAFGVGVSLFIAFLYYALIKFGQVLATRGVIDPLLGVWLGNTVFLVLSGIMILRAKK